MNFNEVFSIITIVVGLPPCILALIEIYYYIQNKQNK